MILSCRQGATVDMLRPTVSPKSLADGSAFLHEVREEDKVSPDSHFLWKAVDHI